jgi:uncharacterized protein (TIGR02599 family)
MKSAHYHPPPRSSGYTLVELMVAMTVFAIVMVGVVMAMQTVQTAWRSARGTVRELAAGRVAIETVSWHLSRATLAPRWEVNDAAQPAPEGPVTMAPESDLHFVCGPLRTLLPGMRGMCGHGVFFQGRFGFAGFRPPVAAAPDAALYYTLPHVINSWGYYVEFGPDARQLPPFITATGVPRRQRFRLMEFRQPAHEMELFFTPQGQARPLLATMTGATELYQWFHRPISLSHGGSFSRDRRTVVVAENILALLVAPYEPQAEILRQSVAGSSLPYQLAPDYLYDSRRHQWQPGSPLGMMSRHQLPPAVEVAVVALAEDAWENLSDAEAANQGEALLAFMSGRFNQAANFANDLRDLGRELDRRRLSHKIFTDVITLDGEAGRLALPPVTVTD